ncbi:MAG: hypothetical protein V1870_02005 [Candidatus Aenigmatarchaeota archaeon]
MIFLIIPSIVFASKTMPCTQDDLNIIDRTNMNGYINGRLIGRDMTYILGPTPQQQGDPIYLNKNGEKVSDWSDNMYRISCSTNEIRNGYKTICFKNRQNCFKTQDSGTMPVQLCVSARPICQKTISATAYTPPIYKCVLVRPVMIWRALPVTNPYTLTAVEDGKKCQCNSICVRNINNELVCMDRVAADAGPVHNTHYETAPLFIRPTNRLGPYIEIP